MTSWEDARDITFVDGMFYQVIGLVEEVAQGGDDQVGCFLGEEVTGGQGGAADIGGVLAPDLYRLVFLADEGLLTPEQQGRAGDLLPGRCRGVVGGVLLCREWFAPLAGGLTRRLWSAGDRS